MSGEFLNSRSIIRILEQEWIKLLETGIGKKATCDLGKHKFTQDLLATNVGKRAACRKDKLNKDCLSHHLSVSENGTASHDPVFFKVSVTG